MTLILNRITPWTAGATSGTECDLFIAAIGYETRSRFLAERGLVKARRRVAIGFEDRNVLKYSGNLKFYREAAFEVLEQVSDTEFTSVLLSMLMQLSSGPHANVKVCVDISSLTRYRLAQILWVVRNLESKQEICIEFIYASARYSPPPVRSPPNLEVGPLPGFAGWDDPTRSITVVVGLGYEQDKALGAVRYIDANEVWVFVPTGHARQYAEKVEHANRQLWQIIDPKRRIEYQVNRPFDCFMTMLSFTRGALRKNRVTLLPFGPKTFALSSMLVGTVHPEVAVWRVSTGHLGEPLDRFPDGKLTGLTCFFSALDVD
jgi:hypothetical protein